MSEEYKLPKPNLPTMDMPTPPQAGIPEGGVRVSCDGEEYQKPRDNSFVTPPDTGIPRILIGIPVLTFSFEFVTSFLKFWTQICTRGKGKMQVGYQFIYRKPVHMAEIQLAEIAIFNKCTHLLLMDDDIYDVTFEDLEKLLAADKDVVGGVMYASRFPYATCVFRRYDVNKKVIDMPSDNSMYRLYEVPCMCPKCGYGLTHWDMKFCPVCGSNFDLSIQKADLIPFAFTLIKTSVFERIKKPWFHCEIEYPTDSWFADRCIEAGIQEYAHMFVRLNHNGVSDVTRPHLFNAELEKKRQSQNAGLVQVSPEEMEKHQYLMHQRMQEAELALKDKPQFVSVSNGEATETAPPVKEEEPNDSQESDIQEVVSQEQGAEVSG